MGNLLPKFRHPDSKVDYFDWKINETRLITQKSHITEEAKSNQKFKSDAIFSSSLNALICDQCIIHQSMDLDFKVIKCSCKPL